MSFKTLGRTALICASLVALAAPALADGIISGVVIDGFTGQPVRGATLIVDGTDISFATGVGGDFRATVPAGTYAVTVTRAGFDPQRVTEVVVSDGGVADFAVVLLPAAAGDDTAAIAVAEDLGAAEPTDEAAIGATAGLEPIETGTAVADASAGEGPSDVAAGAGVFVGAITVEAVAEDSTQAALLAERRNAAQISDAIGADEMSRNAGSDAAEVVKRVVGISLQNDKFVYVRGLGDRYSNTSLNGSKIPSTEFDKKVVPLDLYPAGLLDKIKVSKSYTVDKPGDFAAGLVEMETLDFPLQQSASVGFSAATHSTTTGNAFGQYAGGLGFGGSGGQSLPGSLPNESLTRRNPLTGVGFTPEELQRYGLQILEAGPVWTADGGDPRVPFVGSAGDAPLDSGFNASYGNTFGRLGLVVSGTYDHDYRTIEEEQNFYRYSTSSPNNQFLADYYDFDRDVEKITTGVVGNLAYRITDNHNISFRSVLSTISAAETRLQEGTSSDFGAEIRDYKVEYRNQETRTFQLAGEHYLGLGALGSLLEWRAASSQATTDSDLRFSLYLDRTNNGIFNLTDNAQSLFIYTNDLEDQVDDYAVDWTSFLSGDSWYGSFKGGLAYTGNTRDFAGRRLRFRPRSTTGVDLTQSPEMILVPENIRPGGWEIEEITRPTDFYTGDQAIAAAYAQFDWALNRWRVIGGVRYEASDIEVVTLDRQNPDEPPITSLIEDRDWLPSLGVVYKLANAQNLRLSASQTVNRPEFRELAPFRFKPIAGGLEQTGNPDLVSATIQSFDARWEWFPSAADVIAVSAFYKRFTDPIEAVQVSGAALTETFQNADSARNQGFELELRRNLGAWLGSLQPFTLILNYSFIDSQITLGPNTIQTNLDRPLVGQPDHVGNVVLEWLNPASSSSVRLLYNFTGDKIAFAGTNGLADVIEDARGTIDLVYRQGFRLFGADWTAKLSGENLTEERRDYSQGGEPWRGWDPGRKIGISLGVNLS
ncbi:MAG TPA: TonB-dependent receptor [Methylomirabilota bacterium]|nr:TonB-dependent receptor [Methylomirabilota bacterium]